MKRFKSLISLSLVLCMVLSLFSPVTVFAEDAVLPGEPAMEELQQEAPVDVPAEESAATVSEPDAPMEEAPALELFANDNLCGTNLHWELDANGVLTISGTGDMYDYTSGSAPWYSQRSSIQKIVVAEGVTSVGDYAFYYCSSATEIVLPKTLTAIGYGAFQYCYYVTEITIPGTLTVWESQSFCDCERLTTFTLAGCETAVPSSAFSSCSMLTTVSLPEGVTSISYSAFNNCTKLASCTIPSNCTYIDDYAFQNCTALTAIEIPDRCTYIDYDAFDGCTALETVDLGTGLQTIYPYAFRNCSSLTELDLPDSLTAIGESAFYACTGLERVDFGAGIQTIGVNAFYSCTALTELDLPNSLKTISANGFRDCIKVETVNIGSGIRTVGDAAFGGCSALQTVNIDYYEELMTVDADAFPAAATVTYRPINNDTVLQEWKHTDYTAKLYYDGRLVIEGLEMEDFSSYNRAPWYSRREEILSVIIKDGVAHVGNYAFANCTNLQTVTIGKGVTSIGSSAFSDCSSLTSVTVDAYEYDVTVGSAAFPATATVTYVTPPANAVLKEWAYTDYTATLYYDGRLVISGTAMDNFDAASYTPWYGHKDKIRSVIVENGVTNIGQYAFANVHNLTSVQLPDSVAEIGWYAFAYCYHLTEMTIPDSVETIGGHAFRDCYRMTTLTVGNGLKRIKNDAFNGCYGLTQLTLPDSLDTIEDRAFQSCSNLQTVTIGSGIKEIGYDAFTSCIALTSANLDVYQGTVRLMSRAFPAQTVITYRTATSNTVLYQWEVGAYDETTVTATLYADGRLIFEGVGEVSSIRPWRNYSAMITAIHIGDGITGLPESAFSSHSNLKTVTGMKDIARLEDYIFSGCTSLTSVELGDKVTCIDYQAFYNCSALQTIEIPESVTYIGNYVFCGCTALTEVVIPDNVTHIYDSAFSGCTALKSLTVGRSLGYLASDVFYGCTALETINWNAKSGYGPSSSSHSFYNAGTKGNGITVNIGKDVQSIPAYLFYVSSSYTGCQPKVTTVTVAQDAVLNTIGAFAFYRLEELTDVELGDSLTTIGDGAFNTCSALTRIDLPDSLTSIGARAFYRTALKSATISDQVTSIGENAFGLISDPDFTIYGEAGSQAHIYASAENIPFNSYLRSGSQDGIDWSFDEQTGVLTLTGNGTSVLPIQNAQWDRYLNNAVEIIIGSGITQLGADSFDNASLNGMQGYQVTVGEDVTAMDAGAFADLTIFEIRFKGDQPAVTGGEPQFAAGAKVFHPASANWSPADWPSYTFYPLTGQNVTLTLYDNYSGTSRQTTVTVEGGYPVSLSNYSSEALSRYQQVHSDAYLKNWNTASDGNGTAYGTADSIVFTQDTALYAQWPAYFTVKLNENNGLGTRTYTVREGDYFYLYNNYYDVQDRYQQTMPGATLTYWNTSADGSGTSHNPYTSLYVTENLTLYALWKLPDYISLTFHDNNSYYPTKTTSVDRHISGYSLSLLDYTEQAQARYRAYDLSMAIASWNTMADGSGDSYAADATIYPTADLVLYAQWDLAADQVVASGNDGDIHWDLYSFGTLMVSGQGEMPYYSWNGAPWYSYRDQIKKFVVESGVTSVDHYAFYNCSSLTEVVLPDTLTYIDDYAFYNCSSLKTVTIDTYEMLVDNDCTFADTVTVTWRTDVGEPVFVWDISEEDYDDETAENNVTAKLYGNGLLEISGTGRMRGGLSNYSDYWYNQRKWIREVRVLPGVTNVGYDAFYYCQNLTTVSLPDTLTVIDIDAFSVCPALTAINIDNYELMVVVNCTFPANAVVNWKTAAADDTVLFVWHIGSVDETDVTATLYANGHLDLAGTGTFDELPWPRKITSVTVGEGITDIAWGAFEDCDRLTDVQLPATLRRIGGYAFCNCSALQTITLPGGLELLEECAFTACTSLTGIVIPDAVETIQDGVFEYCTALTEMHLPASLTELGGYAFYDCTALTTVTGLENLTELYSSTFRGCTALTTVGPMPNVTYVRNYAFKDCTALTSVSFGDALQRIGSQAFLNCTSLDSAYLGSYLGGSITEIRDQAFENCTSLTSVVLPHSLRTLYYRAFANCTGLTYLCVGTDLQTLGSEAFADCTGLKTVHWNAKNCHYLSESHLAFRNAGKKSGGFTFTVGVETKTIPAYLFYTSQLDEGTHPRLTAVKMDSYSMLTHIGDFAFYRCLELERVEVGDKLTHILQGAFNTCPKLTEIDLPATLQHVGRKAFFRSGITTAAMGWRTNEIGADAFAECGSGFTLQGYDGSYANLYADENNIPFTAYAMTGTDNGVVWTLDNTGKLTFSGSGTVTADGSWNQHAFVITGIVLESGITGLENPAFGNCPNLTTVLFRGAPPALTAPSERPIYNIQYGFNVYALENNGWEGTLDAFGWWNSSPIWIISPNVTTLTLKAGVDDFSYTHEFTGNAGMWVYLADFSRQVQDKYFAVASDANLVAWSTPSGGTYELDTNLRLGDTDTLYGVWDVPTDVALTLKGNGCSWSREFWQLSGSKVDLTAYSAQVQQYYRDTLDANATLLFWSTRPDGNGEYYAPNETFTVQTHTVLYAQWHRSEATTVASGEFGTGLKWELNSHGVLTVTGEGAMPDNNRPWSRYSSQICSVVIGEGITHVGDYAFDGYSNVAALTLPESLVSIGYYAFSGCGLSSVTLGSNIRTIETTAFLYCSQPFTVYCDAPRVLVDYNTDSFPDDTTFFFEEGSDTDVVGKWEIGTYDETDVTATLYASGRLVIEGKGAFDKSPWSRHITSVEIGEGITAIGSSTFRDCTDLTTVTTPKTLTSVGDYAFRNCTALEEVTNLSNVTHFGWYSFQNCSSLTAANLSSAQEIEHYAFYNTGIEEAYLDCIQYIDMYAFEGCENLRYVIIGDDLQWIGERAFANCPALEEVEWMSSDDLNLAPDYNIFLNSGKESKSGITLYASTEHIPAYLFYTGSDYAGQEPNLVYVDAPAGSKANSPVTIGEFAFFRAVHLESVSALTAIEQIGDGAFNGCTSLESIEIGDNLYTLGAKAFFRTGLTSLAAGRTLQTIGEDAFGEHTKGFTLMGYEDSALHRYADQYGIPFNRMTTSGTVNGINWSFDEATGTLSLTGNGAVTAAPWKHLASQVEHITLSEGITSLEEGVFEDMEVEELVLPASLSTLDGRFIGGVEHAFFLGAAPTVTNPRGGKRDIPITNAYHLTNTPGWDNWDDGYNYGVDLYTFENRRGTLTLKEETNDYTHSTPITGYVGKRIALKAYSADAQERYDEQYGSGMELTGWTDGTNVYAMSAVVTLKDSMTLTAVWEAAKFTVDGTEYPIGTAVSGTGWSYNGYALTLNGYNGGSIEFPGDVDIVAQGTNTVSNGIIVDGSLWFTVENGTTAVTGNPDERKGYALDADYLDLTVNEGAILNVICTEGRAVYSSGNIYLRCNGALNITSEHSTAVYTTKRIYLSGSGILTAQGAKQALYGKTDVIFNSTFDIYLSADATEPAAEYATTPYLRLEGSKWSMTLHANGGAWTDGSAAGKVVTAISGESVYLGEYNHLLTRDGYVLTGWTDEGNTMEFTLSDDVYFEGKAITLYAVWEKDLLTVDGKTFAIDAPASGTGWSYTPAEGKNRAMLTISEGYSGKPIAFTRALDVVITADTVITGTAGVPGISVLGYLRLTVDAVDVTVTGGSGQHAVYSSGTLYLYNDGRTTLSGGAGGSGIYAGSSIQFYNYTGSALTVTGGTRASAVWSNNRTSFKEVRGIITLVAGEGRNAVEALGWSYSSNPRFYAGENAAELTRLKDLSYASVYPYFRIQPKLVVVNMDANGGAINGSQTATLSLLQSDDNSFLLLSQATPVRTGYLFTGWNTEADGSGTAYLEGESYVVKEDATLSLFAQWQTLPTPEASFQTGTSGQSQLTVDIPEDLPAVVETASVLVSCYDKLTGRMLATAFGTKEQTRWVFDIAKQANAEWTMFFLDDKTSYAPIFEALDLNVR